MINIFMHFIDFIYLPFWIALSCNVWVSLIVESGKMLDFVSHWTNNKMITERKGILKEVGRKFHFAWFKCAACLSGQVYLIVSLCYLDFNFISLVLSIYLGALIGRTV